MISQPVCLSARFGLYVTFILVLLICLFPGDSQHHNELRIIVQLLDCQNAKTPISLANRGFPEGGFSNRLHN